MQRRGRRKRRAAPAEPSGLASHARPHFRPDRRRIERADRAQGRPRHLPHHGLHHVRQPGDPREGRHGSWRGVRRHLPRRGALDRHHGALRQLPHRACPRHGAQRLFRLHHGARARRQLAARAWRRVPLRRAVPVDLGHADTRMADQRHTAQSQARHCRRHRPVPRADRLAECRPRGGGRDHPGQARRPHASEGAARHCRLPRHRRACGAEGAGRHHLRRDRRHARRGVARARAVARACRHAAFARADLPQDGSSPASFSSRSSPWCSRCSWSCCSTPPAR